MPLFHRNDPWKNGVRATATIERVVLTTRARQNDITDGQRPEVYLTFRFSDSHGATVMTERKIAVAPVPPAGSIVDVAYLPDKVEQTIDFDQNTSRPPDPDVPRGWGAGIYEVEDLGSQPPGNPDDRRDIDLQRELFRTSPHVLAEVVNYKHGKVSLGTRHGEAEYVLTLRVGDEQLEARAYLAYLPGPGDVILIARSADGSQIALDTDERFIGGRAQGLVFNTPPEVARMRTPEGVAEQRDAAMAKIQERMLAGQRRLQEMEADGRIPTAGIPQGDAQSPQALGLARLEMMRAAGSITEQQFQTMKAALQPD
jgi:hypothetical protein